MAPNGGPIYSLVKENTYDLNAQAIAVNTNEDMREYLQRHQHKDDQNGSAVEVTYLKRF
jgi:hypothetical protein